MERFGPSTQLDEAEYRTEPVQPIAEQVESGRQAASRTVRMGPGNFPENPERASLQPKTRVHAAPQIDVDKYYVIDKILPYNIYYIIKNSLKHIICI